MIAIDPGESGGVASLDAMGRVTAEGMPATEGDILELLMTHKHVHQLERMDLVAVMEEVGGYCGQACPGSAMFNFGRNFGFLLGVLQATGWRVVLVKPQKWQKVLGLGTKSGLTKTQWKNKLKERAQQLHPSLKVTLQTADALLILEAQKSTVV